VILQVRYSLQSPTLKNSEVFRHFEKVPEWLQTEKIILSKQGCLLLKDWQRKRGQR